MHIFFSGIGGTAIGPLALIAKQAGYVVSGSDKQDSQYIEYLRKKGISDIHIGQTKQSIESAHAKNPIDWFVYSSALELEDPNHPEITFVNDNNIKKSKRDELLNKILTDKKLKMLAIAGTHGKTTTTAMVIWLFKQLDIPLSYSVGAKIGFGEMGQYDAKSQFFAYEADEFDHNFLAFRPEISLITGISWDHHEIFKTYQDYLDAFKKFIEQSKHTVLWHQDWCSLDFPSETDEDKISTIGADQQMFGLDLPGYTNRQDAQLAIEGVHKATGESIEKLVEIMNNFPGLQRRMEEIIPGLYSDYAHTPDKVRGGLSVALDLAANQKRQSLMHDKKKPSSGESRTQKYGERAAEILPQSGAKRTPSGNVVVVYEGLTNRRQHYMIDDYKNCFDGAKKVYWIPSYLAREDPEQRIIEPSELIKHLSNPEIAEPMQRDTQLKETIQKHLDAGDMVVAMAGGGGDSLDEWIRQEFSK
jgi:UDP-N-acetylmuramate--alanine ligase